MTRDGGEAFRFDQRDLSVAAGPAVVVACDAEDLLPVPARSLKEAAYVQCITHELSDAPIHHHGSKRVRPKTSPCLPQAVRSSSRVTAVAEDATDMVRTRRSLVWAEPKIERPREGVGERPY
jgi:hypothetical protein